MTFKGELYPFQKEAVERMLYRKFLLLAHEMGLGKTVTTIAALEELIDNGTVKSILVICPASVKWQWKHQIDKFTDGAIVQVVEGLPKRRFYQYRAVLRQDVEYTIMNYEQIVVDWTTIRNLTFDAIVCDEVVAIKSPGAKRTKYVQRLVADYRFGLTGQPIENKPEELYQIMKWVDEDVLGRADIFDKHFILRSSYGRATLYKHLDTLREVMADAMHRRTRAEIADQLPSVVTPPPISIDLDAAGQILYNQIARELLRAIQDAGPNWTRFDVTQHYSGGQPNAAGYAEIMPRLMALRMLCDHPQLLFTSAENFDDPVAKAGSEYIAALRDQGRLNFVRTPGSPKMRAALELIDDILTENPRNKIVLFSFFKPMLGLIGEKLGVEWELFTGDLTPRQRDKALTHFKEDPNCRVLLSSDAGGVGVDLPEANYLVSYDLPWASGKYAQRNSRIIRISSEWPEVTLLSLVVRGSIEERMMAMLEEKAAIAAAWLDGEGVDVQGVFEPTLGTLADFLATGQIAV